MSRNALWADIGARLGFVDYPSTAAGPAKSGPGTAEAVKDVYADYLHDFDELCVSEWQSRRHGQPQSPPSQADSPSYDARAPSASSPSSGPWHSSPMTAFETPAPPLVDAQALPSGFSYDAYAWEAEPGWSDQPLPIPGSWVPSQPVSPSDRAPPPPPLSHTLPPLHPASWDFRSALTFALAGWRPPEWPPCPNDVDPWEGGGDQDYADVRGLLARSNRAATNVSAVVEPLLRLVTAERYDEAQRYVGFVKERQAIAMRAAGGSASGSMFTPHAQLF